MKKLFTVLFLITICNLSYAIDWKATNESVWKKYLKVPMPTVVTNARLRMALEMSLFGGPMPVVNPLTPIGVQLKYWDRVIAQHGIAVVADEYLTFLKTVVAANNNSDK